MGTDLKAASFLSR